MVTNDRFYKQFKTWKNSIKSRHPVCIINDLTKSPQHRLGAIGDMYFVFNKLRFNEDFLVLGGDNLFKSSLIDFIRFAKRKGPYATIGLFDIRNKAQACHYGVVNLNRRSRIMNFVEKPAKPKSSLVAMCLYYFPRQKLHLLKKYLTDPANCSDTAGSYISWLSRKDRVYGYIFHDFWFVVGHLDTYKKARSMLKEAR